MHFRRRRWFHQVTEELQRQGFTPGGRAVSHFVRSYVRNGVYVEICGGNTLRVVKPNGAVHLYQDCSLTDAMQIISAAQLSADFPD